MKIWFYQFSLHSLHSRDWDRDRNSKPRDSRDRHKNLRDSPATKIPRNNKSRHFGMRVPLRPETVPLSRDSMGRKSLIVPGFNLTHFETGTGTKKIAGLSCPCLPSTYSLMNSLDPPDKRKKDLSHILVNALFNA